MDKRLERILPRVQKPARYTGGEYNQILKDRDAVELRLAFCFPDTYEIGMSNLGMSILYQTMNSLPFVWCERVFAPWGDMYAEMKQAGIPLYALESGDPLSAFDSIAFSVGYEMAYTTVLDMLDMAGLPLRSAERPSLLPLVWAGGTAAVNAEPMAPFIDLFVIGEGEEVNNEVLTLLRQAKREAWSKQDFLRCAAQIGGVYVPSLYEVSYRGDGEVAAVTPKDGAPAKVLKRIVEDLDASPFPTRPVVPSTEVVHDRVCLELFRGCVRGCRFCQAGHVYRPIRAKKKETLIRQGIEALQNTGYQELTLLSLSTSDYRELPGLCDGLLAYCEERSIGLSLPSLRADNFSMELMQKLQKVRKSGLTFAVEGGSQRLRDVINKNVTEEDLLNTCAIAFSGGWNNVKLYYMLGLPTETDEDILGIAATCSTAGGPMPKTRTGASGSRSRPPASSPSPTAPFSGRPRSASTNTGAGSSCCAGRSRQRTSSTTGTMPRPALSRRCSPRETAGWPTRWNGSSETGDAWMPGPIISHSRAGWRPSSTAASTRISMPTARSRRMRCSPGITSMSVCAGSTFCASGNAPVGPSFPRTAAVSAPPAVPPAC